METKVLAIEKKISWADAPWLPMILLCLGAMARFAYALSSPPSAHLWSDMKIYNDISNWLKQDVWFTAHFFQSIGYPLVLAGLKLHFEDWGRSLAVLQALLSSATLFLVYRFTLEELGRKIALITLTLGAFHLPWILYTGMGLPETLFTFLLSVAAWGGMRLVRTSEIKYAFLWGIAFMMGFWLKGTHVFWAPALMLGLLWLKKKQGVKSVLVMGSVLAIGLAAHGTLTYVKLKKIQLSAATGGLNFVEGKCPSKKNYDPTGIYWLSPLYLQLGLLEVKHWDRPFTDSRYFFQQGLKCIQDNPLVLAQSFEAIPYLFFGNTMWPFYHLKDLASHARFMELLFAVFVIGGLAFYIHGYLRSPLDREHIVIWLTPVLALFLCVYVFKSELRYRVPFDIWFIPLAVKGWTYFKKS